MEERIEHSEIDLVYMWVDGNDPLWIAKKQQVTGMVSDQSEENNRGRYINNDELRYSLRSAELNVPWIRKIFIVTDNQCPDWLVRDHPKIEVVDHTEILPPEALPCFNSSVIEYFIHRIPGLGECFLLANDDIFFNKPLKPSFFFDSNGLPYVRLKRKLLGRWHYTVKKLFRKRLGQYISQVLEGATMVHHQFGKFYSGVPHHNVDAYRRDDYRYAAEHVFSDRVKASQGNHVRKYGDLHRSAFSYYLLATDKAHLRYVNRRESMRLNVHKQHFMERLMCYNPPLFCLNDSQRVSDADREAIKPFLELLFPRKSLFEKTNDE